MTAETPLESALLATVDPACGLALAQTRARVRAVEAADGVAVSLTLGYPAGDARALRGAVTGTVQMRGLRLARLEISTRVAVHEVQPGVALRADVRNIIAVGSGKGGVGKSTTAVNVALALAALGARVGVLDADVYGPSVPMMLGLRERPESPDGKTLQPLRAHGVAAMSIGLLVEADTPMIWRGPMATSALTQLLGDTAWGDLDYLIVDLPPGTGDIQLTLAQKIPVAGAVVVTTPQDVATLDAQKALRMFEKVNVPVLGIVENMALHACSRCGHIEHLFGEGGGARLAERYGVPLLGSLPLTTLIRVQGDAGTPAVAAAPESADAALYRATALRLAAQLAARPVAPRPIAAGLVG
jgi:ATP-binding protein involved in chromosome partitioning